MQIVIICVGITARFLSLKWTNNEATDAFLFWNRQMVCYNIYLIGVWETLFWVGFFFFQLETNTFSPILQFSEGGGGEGKKGLVLYFFFLCLYSHCLYAFAYIAIMACFGR